MTDDKTKGGSLIGARYNEDGTILASGETNGIPRSELRSLSEQRILSQSSTNGQFGGLLRQILQLSLGFNRAQSNYVCIGSAEILVPANENDLDTGSSGDVVVTRALVVDDLQTFATSEFDISFSGALNTAPPSSAPFAPTPESTAPTITLLANGTKACSEQSPAPTENSAALLPKTSASGKEASKPAPTAGGPKVTAHATPPSDSKPSDSKSKEQTPPPTSAPTVLPAAVKTASSTRDTAANSQSSLSASNLVGKSIQSISGTLSVQDNRGLFESSDGQGLVLAVGLTQFRVDREDNGQQTIALSSDDTTWDNKISKRFELTTENSGARAFGVTISNSRAPLNGCVDISVVLLGTSDQSVTHYCPSFYYVFDEDHINSKGLPEVLPRVAQAPRFYQQTERTVLIWGRKDVGKGWIQKHHLLIDLFDADVGFDGSRTNCKSWIQGEDKSILTLAPEDVCTDKVARIDHNIVFVDRLVSERNL